MTPDAEVVLAFLGGFNLRSTTINNQIRPGDVRREPAGEEAGHAGHLLRSPGPLQSDGLFLSLCQVD